MKRAWLALALSSMVAAGCGDNRTVQKDTGIDSRVDSSNTTGARGGPCYPNNTCNVGLICVNGICASKPDAGTPDLLAGDQGKQKDLPSTEGSMPYDGPKPFDGLTPPDISSPDGSPPMTCNPPGVKTLLFQSDSASNVKVALEPSTTYKKITIASAKPKEAAAALDYNQSWQQVAGFVASRTTSATTATAAAAAAIQSIKSTLFGTVNTVSAGTAGQTHDGHPGVTAIELSLKLSSVSDVSLQRNNVLSALLGVPASSLSGLPASWGAASSEMIVRFAVVLRGGGQVVYIGAVTDKNSDGDASKNTHIISSDLASATGLAHAGKGTKDICENTTLTSPLTPVDIIWVMDESGSMTNKRANIAANASSFFSQAVKKGLNFRMGVTNVCSPNGSYKAAVGKFCSVASTNSQDMGGADNFLLPSQQTIFEACIKNPPGYEGGSEYGLVNAKEAVKRHLPRAANSPSKIRTGAQVVIIVVTDEGPQSMSNVVGYGNLSTCTLPATAQNSLDAALKPYVDYFKGTADPQAKIDFFQTIGGVCVASSTCTSFAAHGYKELSKLFNGKVYDVCQANLGPSITKIVDDIQAAAGAVKVKQAAVAVSMMLAVDGKAVARSRLTGFNYNPKSKTLAFYNVTIKKGSLIVASYKIWK